MAPEQLFIGAWASWSSVFAGGATAVAVSVLMALLGIALGFTVVAPKSDDPTAGLGIAFGFWSFLSIVVSMAAGGFVAGLFAGQRGLEHGLLVWAVIIITSTVFSGIALGSALIALGVALKSLGSGAAGIAGAIGKGAVEAASRVISELRDKVDLSPDSERISDNLATVLRDTGISSLQPDYLKDQMREARSNLRSALYQLSLDPSGYDGIITKFMDTEKSRLKNLSRGIDRDTAVKALMHNRNIPQADAERMVDNALAAYEHVLGKAREALAEAGAQVRDAREYLKGLADAAREKADAFASAAAKAALAASAAIVLAAVVSMGAGFCGASYAPSWDVIQKTYIIR